MLDFAGHDQERTADTPHPGGKRFLDGLVQEHASPQSVADYNAWLDHAIRDLSEVDPEERLFRRVIERMKVDP